MTSGEHSIRALAGKKINGLGLLAIVLPCKAFTTSGPFADKGSFFRVRTQMSLAKSVRRPQIRIKRRASHL